MKKNLFYYLFAMICSVALFASCSDDDDEVTGLTIDQVVGTFTGQLEVLNQSIPGTSIFVTKVDANTVKVELKDFKFSGLTIGDISAECKVALDREGDDFDLNGQATLTVAALGNIELPISITAWTIRNGRRLERISKCVLIIQFVSLKHWEKQKFQQSRLRIL